jgi:hypothetical protein
MYIDPWATYVWNEMLLLCSWNIAITKWKASIHGNKKIILCRYIFLFVGLYRFNTCFRLQYNSDTFLTYCQYPIHFFLSSAEFVLRKEWSKLSFYCRKVRTHNYIKTKSVNNRKTVKTVMTLTWYRHFYRNGGLNQILKRKKNRQRYTDNICTILF